jgi:hypothetical protein
MEPAEICDCQEQARTISMAANKVVSSTLAMPLKIAQSVKAYIRAYGPRKINGFITLPAHIVVSPPNKTILTPVEAGERRSGGAPGRYWRRVCRRERSTATARLHPLGII